MCFHTFFHQHVFLKNTNKITRTTLSYDRWYQRRHKHLKDRIPSRKVERREEMKERDLKMGQLRLNCLWLLVHALTLLADTLVEFLTKLCQFQSSITLGVAVNTIAFLSFVGSQSFFLSVSYSGIEIRCNI